MLLPLSSRVCRASDGCWLRLAEAVNSVGKSGEVRDHLMHEVNWRKKRESKIRAIKRKPSSLPGHDPKYGKPYFMPAAHTWDSAHTDWKIPSRPPSPLLTLIPYTYLELVIKHFEKKRRAIPLIHSTFSTLSWYKMLKKYWFFMSFNADIKKW